LPADFGQRIQVENPENQLMRLESLGTMFATFSLGRLKVTALSDGYADMRASALKGADGSAAPPSVMVEAGLTGDRLRLQVNAFLIQTPDGNVLIDSGSSNAWHATAGRIFDAFDEAGISRNTVQTIAVTHTHVDHVGGLVMPDGKLTFPSAEAVYVPENEIQLIAAETRLAPAADLVRPMKSGDLIGKYITAEAAYGHEIGHSAFLVRSDEAKLLVWGDIVHAPSVQFAYPQVTWEFDANQDEARSTRMKLLERTARERLPVAGAHLAFPGAGYVTASADAYAFLPLS
jgi:glyoxylase-like metal-dependent hydrolase (beta-lactamase superfamily II)